MIFEPPRHGKSEMVTVRYPIYRLHRDPEMRIIVGAYSQMLANKFSRKGRRLAQATLNVGDRLAVEDWETSAGGGLRAIGVGGGITGQGGQLIMIDDPVKSREEAESATYRERVYDWYTDDLYTRLEPGGAIVLIMTRWHEDDLAGRILASEDGPNWTVVSLPAEAEEDDPLGRKVGEALCPERYPLPMLQRIRTVLGSRSYSALYQQRAQPPEGGMFKYLWFNRIAAKEAPKQYDVLVRYWDKAGTQDGGDYTAGVLMGRKADRYYVLDVARGQWSTHNREEKMKETAHRDASTYVDSPIIWIEEEPGSSGKDSSLATITNLAGFPVHAERATGDKAVRAEPFAAQCEAGNVFIAKGAWNGAYLDEMCAFDSGAYDDQVDGSSGAFNKVAMGGEAEIVTGSLGVW